MFGTEKAVGEKGNERTIKHQESTIHNLTNRRLDAYVVIPRNFEMSKKRGAQNAKGLYAGKRVTYCGGGHSKQEIIRLLEREGADMVSYSADIDLLIPGYPPDQATWEQACADKERGATFKVVDFRFPYSPEGIQNRQELFPIEVFIRAMEAGDADWLRPLVNNHSFHNLSLGKGRMGLGDNITFHDCTFEGTTFCQEWSATVHTSRFINTVFDDEDYRRPQFCVIASACEFVRCKGLFALLDSKDVTAEKCDLLIWGELIDARLRGSRIKHWSGTYQRRSSATIENCDLTKAILPGIMYLQMKACTFDHVTFEEFDASSQPVKVIIRSCKVAESTALKTIFPPELRNVEFKNCDLRGASFRGSILNDVTFLDCRMDEVDFRNARFYDVTFTRSSLEKTDFNGALMWHPIEGLDGKNARGAKIDGLGTFDFAAIEALHAQAKKGSFFHSTLMVKKEGEEYKLEMKNLNVSETRRVEVNSRFGWSLPSKPGRGGSETWIELKSVALYAEQQFYNAEILWETIKIKINGKELATAPQNALVVDMWAAMILHEPLDEETKRNVLGVREQEEDRLDAHLENLFLGVEGVNVWNADLPSIIALGELTEGAYEELNLNGARLLAFSDTDFTRTKFREAKFGHAILWDYPVKHRCHLPWGFHLDDFSSSIFNEADLTKARAENCIFTDAQFDKAILKGAVFKQCLFKRTSFRGADLSQVEFEKCRFERCDLTDANIEGAHFNGWYSAGKWPKGFNPKTAFKR